MGVIEEAALQAGAQLGQATGKKASGGIGRKVSAALRAKVKPKASTSVSGEAGASLSVGGKIPARKAAAPVFKKIVSPSLQKAIANKKVVKGNTFKKEPPKDLASQVGQNIPNSVALEGPIDIEQTVNTLQGKLQKGQPISKAEFDFYQKNRKKPVSGTLAPYDASKIARLPEGVQKPDISARADGSYSWQQKPSVTQQSQSPQPQKQQQNSPTDPISLAMNFGAKFGAEAGRKAQEFFNKDKAQQPQNTSYSYQNIRNEMKKRKRGEGLVPDVIGQVGDTIKSIGKTGAIPGLNAGNSLTEDEQADLDFKNLPAQEKGKLVNKVVLDSQKKQEMSKYMAKVDQVFVNDLKNIVGDEELKKMEETGTKIKGLKNTIGSYGKAFASGRTLGIADGIVNAVEKNLNLMDNKNTGGYEPGLLYEDNKQLLEATNTAAQVMSLAGGIHGGSKPYGEISGQIQSQLGKVQGKFGQWMAKHPITTSYTVQNLAEEAVQGGVKKATGQEYTPQDFLQGLAYATLFNSIGQAGNVKKELKKQFSGSPEPVKIWQENPQAVMQKVEAALTKAEQQKGSRLNSTEVFATIMPLKISEKYNMEDLFKESRLVHLKGMNKGRAGIDYAAPLPMKKGLAELKTEVDNPSLAKKTETSTQASTVTDETIAQFKQSLPESERVAFEKFKISDDQIRKSEDFQKWQEEKVQALHPQKSIEDFKATLPEPQKQFFDKYGITDDQIRNSEEFKTWSQSKPQKVFEVKPEPSVTEPKEKKMRGFAETVLQDPNTKPMIEKEIKKSPDSYYNQITNKDTLEAANKAIETDRAKALQDVYEGDFTADNNAKAQMLIKQFQEQGDYDSAVKIINHLQKKATTAGQAIQILSLYNKLTPEGIINVATKELDKARKQGFKVPEKLTPEQQTKFAEQVKEIQKMPEGKDKMIKSAELMRDIAELTPASFAEKVSTFQTMGQLLNVKTITRNLIGNAGFHLTERLANNLAAAIDIPVSFFTGKRSVVKGSGQQYRSGFVEGAKQGYIEGKQGVDLGGPGTQFDLNQNQNARTFRGKGLLGQAEKIMNISLKGSDKAFYTGSYQDALYQAAKTEAINKGLKGEERKAFIEEGMNKPTEEMTKAAEEKALYDTFQDKNPTVAVFQAIKSLFNAVGIGAKGERLGSSGPLAYIPKNKWGAGDLILKYPKTPANILNRGIAYSPAGFVKAIAEGAKGNQAGAVNATARASIGTGMFFLGSKLLSNGILTASPEKDRNKAGLNAAEGQSGPFTINTNAFWRWVASGGDDSVAKAQPGDNFVSYDWAQPTAISLSSGGQYQKKLADKIARGEINFDSAKDIAQVINIGMQQGLTGADTLMEQPLVKGVKDLASTKDVESLVRNLVTSGPASFTPTALKQIRDVVDNQAKETYSDDMLQESLNRVLNKIPGAHSFLQNRKDIYGEDKETYQDGTNSILNVFLNPAFVSTKKGDPLNQYLLQLNAETGESNFFPVMASRKVQVGEQSVDLSTDEYTKFQETSGKLTRKQYDHMVNHDEFKALEPDEQAKELSNALSEIKEYATGEYYFNHISKLKRTQGESTAQAFLDSLSKSQQEKMISYMKTTGKIQEDPEIEEDDQEIE